ncbi:hypothetical protein Adt_33420 [Abeliophyllum distichum]|uniref:Uncharacterized protein n=1 Tax=Abeliophyllum distichum TaxID=126358 RepID=A0ABD1QW65_9LAMI
MSSKVGSDSGREAMSWDRGQEEEEASSGRMVKRIDVDEVLSPAPLSVVPPLNRSSRQAETSGEREAGPGTLGRNEAEVESGIRSAPIWKCKFFPSEVNEKQLRDCHRIYKVPDDIEFFIPGPNDQADDPLLGCMALNQAVLAAELRLPFPRIVRKFLREWRIAPTQLCPNSWRRKLGLVRKKERSPLGDQEPSVRQRVQSDLPPQRVPSPAWSIEEITSFPVRPGPSSPQACRAPPSVSQILPTYLRSTLDKDEEFLRLCRAFPKPVRNFIRSNSPSREEIAGLSLSTRRAIRTIVKCWTPVQQKYLDTMGVVDSVIAASVNTSRAAIRLTLTSEKMSRLLADILVMREEGLKVVAELQKEKRLRATSEDVLMKREEEMRKKESELEALRAVVESDKKSKADLEALLEKREADLKVALERSVEKDKFIKEFNSFDEYLDEQEKVYFLIMEELIETIAEKCPYWDVQFLKDELDELKRTSKFNLPSLKEGDQTGAK